MKTNEQYAADAEEIFDKLFAENSPVKLLSEARRENSAQPYSEENTRRMFDEGLADAVSDFGEIVEAFGAPREKHRQKSGASQ